jgi:hypothetical protein
MLNLHAVIESILASVPDAPSSLHDHGDLGILNPTYHHQLLHYEQEVIARCGVTSKLLRSTSKGIVTEAEWQWLEASPPSRKDCQSLVVDGTEIYGKSRRPVSLAGPCLSVHTRMQAMACAFLRTYRESRVALVRDVAAALEDGESYDGVFALLIPNFQLNAYADFSLLTKRQSSLLLDLILRRSWTGKVSALFCEDLGQVPSLYGSNMESTLHSNSYDIVKGPL